VTKQQEKLKQLIGQKQDESKRSLNLDISIVGCNTSAVGNQRFQGSKLFGA